MKGKIFIIACIVLLLSSSVLALGIRTPQTAVSNLRIRYDDACFKAQWDTAVAATHTAADFNNYRLQVTSSVAAFDGLDENVTAQTRDYCTVVPGDTISIILQRFDGNIDGHWVSQGVEGGLEDGAGDINVSLETGTVTGAGMFLFYAVLVAIAGLAALIIIITVVLAMLGKLGMGKILKF